MSYDFYDYTYTSVADLKEKAADYIKYEAKHGNILNPVVLEGRNIATSWWGKAWCNNLERYADYKSRLERGRRYVRANCVLDLNIDYANVVALVQGSQKNPYRVQITIDPLPELRYQKIIYKCSSKIENIESLINGKFPNELKELFADKKAGLFPSMKEIHFKCTCPDWADMCKHTAAVLYGIGNRFDTSPLLFFKLRGINIEEMASDLVDNRLEQMLNNADKASSRILDDSLVNKIFGI